MSTPITDFGTLIEGVVEQDPCSGHCTIRTTDATGKAVDFDPSTTLARYVGQEVRFILTSFDTLNRLQDMVDSGDLTHQEES